MKNKHIVIFTNPNQVAQFIEAAYHHSNTSLSHEQFETCCRKIIKPRAWIEIDDADEELMCSIEEQDYVELSCRPFLHDYENRPPYPLIPSEQEAIGNSVSEQKLLSTPPLQLPPHK